MKKYKVYANGIYLISFNRRYEAEEAIRNYQRMENVNSAIDGRPAHHRFYEIRR